MRPRYDILAIDLDGTLLNSRGEISEPDRLAIARAEQAGLTIVVATGRAHAECRHVLEALDHRGLLIAASGSLLIDADTGHTLDRRTLPADIVREVAGSLVADGHRVLILKDSHRAGYDYITVGDGPMHEASAWWFSQLPARVRHAPSLDHDEHPDDSVRASAVACGISLPALVNSLRERLANRCLLQHWSAVTQTDAIGSPTHLLEAFLPNVNKWTMLESLCEVRGINPARVAAIGDGLNDVELIRDAGLGIAMANAVPGVLDVADRVTADHDSGGVAHAIDHILRGAW